ncbi:ammonium transporter [Roseospira marina]|uniref:Ammonium transporter n=1 Tax=Roseospira marina TaxID=140057 RepID=A0A5M6IBN5_9PROT|nr:ammonium transporter [Roseospira marina]KAA5605651.1 ammonium transporter [Roseospira marina]MBB4313273.1 Amt family ammonium transporter [Roseospira marina]MBB5085986.1 Amt family ammonium transporter [Roseospira marina]
MSDQHMIWLALSTFLVLLMQAGFTCYEAGMVRRKNSVNVAIKNVADLGTTIVFFMLIGNGLMFGASWFGLLGHGASVMVTGNASELLVALFQAMFCGTAITIVSGAVSERTSFGGYLLLAICMSVLVYPVSGHWAWGQGGWLAELGFLDFAGSTVVHAVGGAIALAAVLHIGPRLGRFDGTRPSGTIDGDNLALSALGAFLLMFGWFGFNSGAAKDFEHQVPLILVNTGVGAAVGIVAVLAWAMLWRRKPKATEILTGMLGGLVSITAGCSVVQPLGAMAIGAMGALVAVWGLGVLERVGIDDPVGAIPVHLFAGVLGTVMLPLFATPEHIPPVLGGRLAWVAVQMLGAVVIPVFAFVVAWVFMAVTSVWIAYRVSPEDERIGLNVAEHGAGTAMLDLLNQLSQQGAMGDFSTPVEVDEETDAAHVAWFYNQVRERFVRESERSRKLLDEAAYLALHDPLTGLKNRRAFMLSASDYMADLNRYSGDAALIMLDLDHFKAINDTHGHDVGDEVLIEVARRLHHVVRETDAVARLGGEEFAVIVSHATVTEGMVAARRILAAINREPFATATGPLPVTASLGLTAMARHAAFDDALKAADDALYEAKRTGRNRMALAVGDRPDIAGTVASEDRDRTGALSSQARPA